MSRVVHWFRMCFPGFFSDFQIPAINNSFEIIYHQTYFDNKPMMTVLPTVWVYEDSCFKLNSVKDLTTLHAVYIFSQSMRAVKHICRAVKRFPISTRVLNNFCRKQLWKSKSNAHNRQHFARGNMALQCASDELLLGDCSLTSCIQC